MGGGKEEGGVRREWGVEGGLWEEREEKLKVRREDGAGRRGGKGRRERR
jgi:hypothetical protein